MSINTFCIADFLCSITFEDGQGNTCLLIPSFEPFRVENTTSSAKLLFHLHVDDRLKSFLKSDCERIKRVENDNGDIVVDHTKDGNYQFIIKDAHNQNCCILQTNDNFSLCRCALRGSQSMRSYGLNNALMLVFAFAGCSKGVLLIHASTVRKNSWGYAFTAKSGTGKSTHVAQWLINIPNCDLLNDDNPIIKIVDGYPYIYGSPWSGKTSCYRNIKARLGAIVKINRAEENYINPATTIEAFVTLLSASATMKWDSTIFGNICSLITTFIETTPNFNLFCRPDSEAAIICHKVIRRHAK